MIEDEAQTGIFLPTINMLGKDLVTVTRPQQIWTLAKPLLCTLAYVVFALLGLWPLAVLAIVFLTFNTFVSSSHDLVHMSLGLPRRVNDRWLTVIELLSLRSGHAFRTCHWNHHQHFPDWQDIEGRAVQGDCCARSWRGPSIRPSSISGRCGMPSLPTARSLWPKASRS